MAERDKGFEYLDDTPVEVPVKLRRKGADSWAEMVQRVVAQISQQAADAGGETFEESLDFGEDDDEELPISQSELRYLKEEELLTEALTASRIRDERHRAAQLHKEYTRGRRKDVDGESGGVGASRGDGGVGSGDQISGASGGKAGDHGGGAAGVQGSGRSDGSGSR